MPILALPPVQRSAVWRPKQVLDLWDSMMRGMPIGAFYLVCKSAVLRDVVVPGTNTVTPTSAGGFDLLDGQQRVRALMLGLAGPAEEKRCLWVDLGASDAVSGPCLRLTSKAQPFGYDAKTGEKLSLDQRRKGRERLEPKPDERSEFNPEKDQLQCVDGMGKQRRAYDLELFDCQITLNGRAFQPQPPLPYEATGCQTFKLHDLLAAWRARVGQDTKAGVTALCGVTGQPQSKALTVLHEAFCKVEQAQIALLKVNPDDLRGENLDLSLLELFERVGAGGTPLSGEERLYSIYKHYKPNIRGAVDAIHRDAGRVLPPTKIITAALRIANARTDERANNVPDPVTFAKSMKGKSDKEVRFRTELDKMLSLNSRKSGIDGRDLHQGFVFVKFLLSYDDGAGDFWLPDVMLAALPPELWHVLVLWAVTSSNTEDQQLCREEAVRFALFWHLCVTHNENAAGSAFAYIKTVGTELGTFPGYTLYKRLIGATGGEAYAHALPPLDEFERKLCREEALPAWQTDEERFNENNVRNYIGSNWWWHGRKMLPWLQRAYVREAFPGYVPLSEHEDDLPYDVDHICPYKDWGDWRSVWKRLDAAVGPELRQRMRDGRNAIGNGIGNLRLVDSSINKRDQDADISEKMPFAVKDDVSGADRADMIKSAFPPEHRALWKRVSRAGGVEERKWDLDRLAALQHAVEQRAAWLYSCFYNELGYKVWTSSPRLSNGSSDKS